MAKILLSEKEYYEFKNTLELDGEGTRIEEGNIELDIPDEQVKEVKNALYFIKLLNNKFYEILDENGGGEQGDLIASNWELSVWRQITVHRLSWEKGVELLNK